MMIMMMMMKKVKGYVSVRCKQRKEKVKELGSKWKGQARPLRMRDMPTRVQQADKKYSLAGHRGAGCGTFIFLGDQRRSFN